MASTPTQLLPRYVLFFDTETNGLPSNFRDPAQVIATWPALVQIAWQLRRYTPDEEAGALVEIDQRVVRPAADIKWNEGALQVHGITRERAEASGEPLATVMDAFFAAAGRADVLVAHNMAFDRTIVESELYRAGDYSRRWPTALYCTQTATTALCQLPGFRGQFKFPKLVELHRFLFRADGDFEWHSAQGDVACMVACFERLRWLRYIPFAAPSDALVARRMSALRAGVKRVPENVEPPALPDAKRPSLVVRVSGEAIITDPDMSAQDGSGTATGARLGPNACAPGVDPVAAIQELDKTAPQGFQADDAEIVTRWAEEELQW